MSMDGGASGADGGLERFVRAQEACYQAVLKELRAGHKRTHWMWFVFPQLRALGWSQTSKYYGISGIDEARAYLQHPLLSSRLVECVELVLSPPKLPLSQLLGRPDDKKFSSCVTLFAGVAPRGSVYHLALQERDDVCRDSRTQALLCGVGGGGDV